MTPFKFPTQNHKNFMMLWQIFCTGANIKNTFRTLCYNITQDFQVILSKKLL